MMRKRIFDTGAAVVFWTLRRSEMIPFVLVPSLPVTLRRLGAQVVHCELSIRFIGTAEFLTTGLARFCGPGAPRRWPAGVGAPVVSAKMKSVALTFVSTAYPPPVGHPPKLLKEPP